MRHHLRATMRPTRTLMAIRTLILTSTVTAALIPTTTTVDGDEAACSATLGQYSVLTKGQGVPLAARTLHRITLSPESLAVLAV